MRQTPLDARGRGGHLEAAGKRLDDRRAAAQPAPQQRAREHHTHEHCGRECPLLLFARPLFHLLWWMSFSSTHTHAHSKKGGATVTHETGKERKKKKNTSEASREAAFFCFVFKSRSKE